jgi:hypothetical protein
VLSVDLQFFQSVFESVDHETLQGILAGNKTFPLNTSEHSEPHNNCLILTPLQNPKNRTVSYENQDSLQKLGKTEDLQKAPLGIKHSTVNLGYTGLSYNGLRL